MRTITLEVRKANREDIRRLTTRMHEDDFQKLGIPGKLYIMKDVIVVLKKNCRKIVVLAKSDIILPSEKKRTKVNEGEIKLDEYMRCRLGIVDKGDKVEVCRAKWRHKWSFLYEALCNHPDIVTKWQNIGLLLTLLGVILTLFLSVKLELYYKVTILLPIILGLLGVVFYLLSPKT